ncbi:MAG: TIGR04282 family arsenosugar biosynthesis glycosyltransferase [Streptomycetales bacterium]
MIGAQIVVLAKEPVPGRAKTRLCPPYLPAQAARLAEAALTDTLGAVGRTPVRRGVLALRGRPGPWLPAGFDVIAQRGDGLDERIAAALADAHAGLACPLLLVGMDTPQLTPELLGRAAVALCSHDAVLGPARDGGFWLLGMRLPDAGLVRGVPMSTPYTGRAQLGRLRSAGLRVALLPPLTDVDTPADAVTVAREAPRSAFATALAALPAVQLAAPVGHEVWAEAGRWSATVR